MTYRRTRQGYTLIELLVVIAIIAILMSLMVGAIQKVRETANSMQSANNLRNIGMAVNNCATQNKGKIPPAWGRFRASKPATAFVHLLPYMDQDPIYKEYFTVASPDTVAAINSAVWGPGTTAIKIYVANNDVTTASVMPGARENSLSSYVLNSSLFVGAHPQWDYRGVPILPPLGADGSFRFDKLLTNGATNSLVAIEQAAVCNWAIGTEEAMPAWYLAKKASGGDANVRKLYAGNPQTDPTQIRIEFTFSANTTTDARWNPMPVPPSQVKPPLGKGDLAFVSAFQTGSVNALMADGGVRGVSPNVQHDVFRAVALVTAQANAGLLNQWDD